MKLIKFIKEEIQKLFEERIYSIPELVQMMGRVGYEKEQQGYLANILRAAFRRYGDQGVVDKYGEMSGVEIHAISKGRYVFAGVHKPESY